MQKFIVLRFSLISKNWEVVSDFDCIVKAITFYDRQLSYHPTSMFMIAVIIVESA